MQLHLQQKAPTSTVRAQFGHIRGAPAGPPQQQGGSEAEAVRRKGGFGCTEEGGAGSDEGGIATGGPAAVQFECIKGLGCN